jgi:hypothetical protein
MSYKYIVTFAVCAVFLVFHTPRRLPAAVCYPNLQQPLCVLFVPDLCPHVPDLCSHIYLRGFAHLSSNSTKTPAGSHLGEHYQIL